MLAVADDLISSHYRQQNRTSHLMPCKYSQQHDMFSGTEGPLVFLDPNYRAPVDLTFALSENHLG